jgi:hypothetical protein
MVEIFMEIREDLELIWSPKMLTLATIRKNVLPCVSKSRRLSRMRNWSGSLPTNSNKDLDRNKILHRIAILRETMMVTNMNRERQPTSTPNLPRNQELIVEIHTISSGFPGVGESVSTRKAHVRQMGSWNEVFTLEKPTKISRK